MVRYLTSNDRTDIPNLARVLEMKPGEVEKLLQKHSLEEMKAAQLGSIEDLTAAQHDRLKCAYEVREFHR